MAARRAWPGSSRETPPDSRSSGERAWIRRAASRVTDDARSRARSACGGARAAPQSGFVRQCHGDLHLRNIVLLDGRPTLFDGVEFNDEISCTDVLYDLAFLLMDLWRRRLPRHANTVWNRYLVETADFDGVSLLPLFLSCRAAVRAKTSATAAQLQQEPATPHVSSRAWRASISPWPKQLSASGRSMPPGGWRVVGLRKVDARSRARAVVGAVPGAVVLRSDETRKRLCGVPLCSASVPKDIRRTCPSASTPPWQSRPHWFFAQATASSSMRCMRGRPTEQAIEQVAREPPRCHSSGCGSTRRSRC